MPTCRRLQAVPVSLVVATILAGCEAAPITETPRVGTLEYVSGDGQAGTVGLLLGQQLIVRLVDQFGTPVAGETVAFEPSTASTALGATTDPVLDVTGSDGIASAQLRLGTGTGPYRVTATWPGLETGGISGQVQVVDFDATAGPAPAAALTITAGNNQTAAVNTLLPIALAVRVADAFNNPISGATVTFVIGSGGGQLSVAEATSNASGIASASWTLGPTAGMQSVTAFIPGVAPVTFNATAK
jgi:adhesin/invasin